MQKEKVDGMNECLDGNYRIIDTQKELEALADRLMEHAAVSVDLEADSMYHYREKVCLIQIGSAEGIWVVDPLKIDHLDPLKPFFADGSIQKVFHGSDYDVRSLYRDFGIEINNLFDTQLASMFLGKHETSLEAVIKKRFHVQLDKKYQRKDWSKRPLPAEMFAYAAGDVHYLIPLAEMLKNELEDAGRASWVAEECRLLSQVRPPDNPAGPLFLKIKGAGRLRSRSLAVLESLLVLRDTVACEKDRPVFKVFSGDPLLKLSVARPVTVRRLEKLGIFSSKQIQMFGKQITAAICRALEMEEAQLPVYPRKKNPRMKPEVPARVTKLKIWRERKARDLGLDPGLICNKTLITALAVEHPGNSRDFKKIDKMKDWQIRTFGGELLTLLNP